MPMPKRRAQNSQRQGKRPRPAIKKHLYLVLDDWERGYSIRQIDPDTMLCVSDSDDFCTNRDPTHLPEPAAFRFVAPALDTQFIAMGSNIVVVSSSGAAEAPTLVYDTGAAALATGPPLAGPPLRLAPGGDAVYALTTLGAGLPLAFEAFSWAPRTGDAAEPGRPTHAWSWKSVAAPPPPLPPFAPEAIVSYAVHPDGRTIFVSTAARAPARGSRRGTHSFDTARREWRCHGDWVLPFHGQGFFDRELDAWVGLDEERGCVCACQVASRSTTSIAPPESDRMEEKLFCFCAAGESTRSEATLAYMGDSKFCLVESVPRPRGEEDAGLGNDRVVRVTMFGLKFDRKGKLRITSHRTSSSYVASKHVTSFSPVAFWM
ncbi:hypothetical protein SORBI_3004G248200 [Sorghum bicolor]|uniref:DUF1618 domain-containing protein n=1 Tax=Sorghum bicolor TaxID=4558 RepID=A0A1Z5RPY3_SORBI|nr:hypothetical protein SORBI_3004G248200 [Sorghum bicolor]